MGKRLIKPYVGVQAVSSYQPTLNLSKISKQLQFSRSFVRGIVTKFEECAKVDDMKQSGRPKSLSDRVVRETKESIQDDNRLSAVEITTDLNMSLSELVSKRTVHRYLKKLDYKYSAKTKKQWLSAKHRKVRVQWCEQDQHWTFQDWRKGIFSDELTFYVLKRKTK